MVAVAVAAEGEVGGDDAVAGNLVSVGVAVEGLADGAGGAAADGFGNGAVGGDFASGDAADGVVDALLEGGGAVVFQHADLGLHG